MDEPARTAEATAASTTQGGGGRQNSEQTRTAILEAARGRLVAEGVANLSTRGIAKEAGVPLSQIHYHFGGKPQLILALLDHENERLLDRQARLYAQDMPLWKQWEQACDYLDDDLASGYVRVLQEMIAVGWSDPQIATHVRADLAGWRDLLVDVARRAGERLGGLGPFTADEFAALVAIAFLGAEATILLGFTEDVLPARTALRRVGDLIRRIEEADETGRRSDASA